MTAQILLPEGWPRPRGYSNGVAAEGRMVFVAGQIGWDERGVFHAADFPGQFRQTLLNTLAVLEAGGAGPEHVVRMTWFITDKPAYLASLREIGANLRNLFFKTRTLRIDIDEASRRHRQACLAQQRCR